MTRRPPLTPLQRAATLALAIVLVLAQTLGWLHRSAHGTPPAAQAVALQVHSAAAQPQAGKAEAGKAFGHEAGATECRLYDVLAQPGCASTPLLALPVAPPATWIVATLGDFVARWAALFDARGPPASR